MNPVKWLIAIKILTCDHMEEHLGGLHCIARNLMINDCKPNNHGKIKQTKYTLVNGYPTASAIFSLLISGIDL